MNVKLKVIYFSVLSCFILQGCAAARLGGALITAAPHAMFSKPDPNAPRRVSDTEILQQFVGKPASTLNQYLGKPYLSKFGAWQWGKEKWVIAKDRRETLHRDVCRVYAEVDKNDIITSIYYEEEIWEKYSVDCPPTGNIPIRGLK